MATRVNKKEKKSDREKNPVYAALFGKNWNAPIFDKAIEVGVIGLAGTLANVVSARKDANDGRLESVGEEAQDAERKNDSIFGHIHHIQGMLVSQG